MKKAYILIALVAAATLWFFAQWTYNAQCWKRIPSDMHEYVYYENGEAESGIGPNKCQNWRLLKDEYRLLKSRGIKNSPEGLARTNILWQQKFANMDEYEFTLEKVFQDESFARFDIMDADSGENRGSVYLKKNDKGEGWQVIWSPRTAHDVQAQYPELKGR